MTKKAYVIGSNVKESLSPLIFNYWFKKRNIDAEYSFIEIEPNNFDKEIGLILKEKNLCGLNVTIPFKELIIKKLNGVDSDSKKIGAVNCVTKQNNLWIGKNTDWVGFLTPFLKAIKKENIKKNNLIVLGYGGAAKAIIYALQKQGFKKIKIFNRTFKKIEKLDILSGIDVIKFSELESHIKKTDIIINTTPVNLLDDFGSLVFKTKKLAFDIVYKPKKTDFLSNFTENNRIYGINMLVYQAAPCFEEWFGEKAVIDKKLFDLLEDQISQ